MGEATEEGVEATEDVGETLVGDSVMATTTAITGDLDTVGGVILTGGIIGGTIPTGGIILTMLTPTLTTILITMVVMGNRRYLHKGLFLRQNRDDSNLLIGTSVRIQRVTTPTLKIARVVG
jgi:hypothetical protein